MNACNASGAAVRTGPCRGPYASGKKIKKRSGRLLGQLLSQVVPAGQAAAADIGRPVPPDGERVVPGFKLAVFAPQRQHGTADPTAGALILIVVHAVDHRRGP